MCPQSKGGQATAIILRKRAIDNYYSNPNYCKQCKNIIHVSEGQKVQQARIKIFCSHTCAAKFSNTHREKIVTAIINRPRHCNDCKAQVTMNLSGYYPRLCSECLDNRNNKTKSQSGHRQIRGRARYKLIHSDIPQICHICSYDKHVEACHIKPVSKFPNETLVSEINALTNLAYLCPNCHWELDHNMLTL